MATSRLKDFNVLVVDADNRLAQVFCGMLERMGFTNIDSTTDGQEAINILKMKPIDFMITEWNTQKLDGIEILGRIRREHMTNDPTLPTIMLTGRAEKGDVVTARDYGINEYVIKPFTAKTVFSRMERLIEMPRNFIISQFYIGPDRRSKNTLLPKGVNERRKDTVKVEKKPANVNAAPDTLPKVWAPDYTLKLKLGRETALSSVITPQMISDAQATIETVPDSVEWLKENLEQLRALQKRMIEGDLYTLLPIDMSEIALTLSSRSGTFGYNSASKVAYLLYLFCRNHLRVDDHDHHMVAEKHLDALTAALSDPKREKTTSHDHEIVCELRNLIDKYAV